MSVVGEKSLSLRALLNGNEACSNVHNDTNSILGRDFHSVSYWSESLSLRERLNGSEYLKIGSDSEWCLES
jgi:hypothetical protein